MKKIQVELSQTGTDIITQSSVKIRVGGQFVKNSLVDIINSSTDNIVKNVKVEAKYDSHNELKIDILFPSGNSKRFFLKKPDGFKTDYYTYLIDTQSLTAKDVLKESLLQIQNTIKEIEKYILDNSSTCNNYFFEV